MHQEVKYSPPTGHKKHRFEVYYEGWRARRAGKSRTDCPYGIARKPRDNRLLWLKGHQEAGVAIAEEENLAALERSLAASGEER